MISLSKSIQLAAHNLIAQLSPKRDDRPMWRLQIEADLTAVSHFAWPTHNIGRITDALLRVEEATGIVVEPAVEKALRRGLATALDNPLGVGSLIYGIPWEKSARAGMFDGHSERELLLALSMLVRHRGDEWAAAAGRRMISALDHLINADGSWDYRQFVGAMAPSEHRLKLERLASTNPTDLSYTHGRLIEALVEFYSATGFERAVELARRLVTFHMTAEPPAERVKSGLWIHHHSIFGTYRGIFRYGEVSGDEPTCSYAHEALVNEALPRLTESGFIPEGDGIKSSGETTSPGDVAQLALWVARWAGRSRDQRVHGAAIGRDLLDHVERIVRARLLPSQIVDDPGIRETKTGESGADDSASLGGAAPPDRDREFGPVETLRARAVGAYGGVHGHPYGRKRPTTDVTAATLHTMCDILRHVGTVGADTAQIDLHFDFDSDDVTVSSSGGQRREVTIVMARPRSIRLRMPGWVDAQSIALQVNDVPKPPTLSGGYLVVAPDAGSPSASQGSTVTVSYALPERRTSELAAGDEYHLKWRGDEVVGITPNAPYLPFYPDIQE